MPAEHGLCSDAPAPYPVHALLAEHHQSEAARARNEAARLLRPTADMRLHPDTHILKRQLAAALQHAADLRDRLARTLTGTPE